MARGAISILTTVMSALEARRAGGKRAVLQRGGKSRGKKAAKVVIEPVQETHLT